MAHRAPNDRVRVAARLANAFALDLVRLGGFGRDVIDGLLMVAISQANVAQIMRRPELQLAYATLDHPPPDEFRRPVSVSAIANSLRIPFETARRRISTLTKLGVVQSVPRGVIIPQAPLNSPYYRIGAEAHYALVRGLYGRLRGAGLLDDLPTPQHPGFDAADPPVRLVTRLSADFLLRFAEPLTLYIGDIVTALVMMDMVQANTAHLPDADGGAGGEAWSPESFVPDAERKPVRASALAQRLGIPAETIRRHVAHLLDADRCVRLRGGYVVPSRVLARPPLVRHMLDNESHLRRFYGALAEFGVLAEWQRDPAALRGAA